jgi:pimeloyl-ACP methyl ester carboxylesterase
LFLHGNQDVFVPPEGSERTAKAIPDCIFKYLKNCGHSPMLEVFDDYFKEVF